MSKGMEGGWAEGRRESAAPYVISKADFTSQRRRVMHTDDAKRPHTHTHTHTKKNTHTYSREK